MIVEVLPRRNKLSRLAADPKDRGSQKPMEQVIVANVDLIIPVFAAANPTPKWNLLDRYLATAELAEIPAVICITKMDLLDTPPVELEIYPNWLSGLSDSTVHQRRTLSGGLKRQNPVFVGNRGLVKPVYSMRLNPALAAGQ
jgi:putative ribosome biogenesis GTPase RsgA